MGWTNFQTSYSSKLKVSIVFIKHTTSEYTCLQIYYVYGMAHQRMRVYKAAQIPRSETQYL
jgi:hypothetical protein